LQKIYEQNDVGILDNNMERYFGLYGVLSQEPYVIFGEDLDEHFRLEKSLILRLISGEPVIAARLNREPVEIENKAHLAFCGNKIIGYEDNKGELARHIVAFIFDKKVPAEQMDPKLYEKLDSELPAILQKVSRGYLEYAQKYESQNIWNVLPEYFTGTRKRISDIISSN
jgi:phage/plasmid-associated DNA primase